MPRATKIKSSTRITPPAIRRIALVMHPWAGYLHQVRLGITDYAQQKTGWRWLELLPAMTSFDEIANINVDGYIVFSSWAYVDQLKALRGPLVDVSNWVADLQFPCVVPDDHAIGTMAAEYLLGLGPRNFAYVGVQGAHFSALRQQAFTEAITRAGFKVSIMTLLSGSTLRSADEPDPLKWLRRLPRPAVLFAANDNYGKLILELCQQLHISVPDELCVLGVDDDELVSRITHPPLSSIAIMGRKIGFEAARMLDDMLSGRTRRPANVLLPPTGIVARQSTSLLAISDPDVLAAVRFIRAHVEQQITVRDVLREVPVNRRYLERKFLDLVGRTPMQEIRRVRLEQVQRLLSDTDLSMPAIARRSGYRNAGRMASVFRQMTGMTPTRYRRKFRMDDRF